MKKLFVISSVLIAFSAASLFANESINNNGNAQSFYNDAINNDTTPKKGDTTSPKRDSGSLAYTTIRLDTVPKKDSTRKADSIAFAVNQYSK